MTQQELDTLKGLLEGQLRECEVALARDSQSESTATYADMNDQASRETERAFTLHLKDRHRKLAVKVRRTLAKIENDTYGLCESCEEPIGYRRLLARPVTDLCIDCKTESEQQERQTRIFLDSSVMAAA
jgi:DnaK suppressor protein